MPEKRLIRRGSGAGQWDGRRRCILFEIITDSRYGYNNTIPATPLPVLSPEDTLRQTTTDVRLMNAPLERLKGKAEYDGNPQTSPESSSMLCFMLEKPQFVTKVRMMPLNADNGIVPGNRYELYGWSNGDGKQIFIDR